MPRVLKHLSMAIASLTILALLLYLFRAPILRTAADLWIIDNGPAPADAIVVLGGGLQNRPFAAAKLYHQGHAPKIIFFNVKPDPITELGLTLPEHALTRRLLIIEGVPESALIEVGYQVASTRDEARAARAWALSAANPQRLLVVTDPFHTRRANWHFHKTLKGSSATSTITVAPRTDYTTRNWWATEQGLINFQNEIMKSIHNRFK